MYGPAMNSKIISKRSLRRNFQRSKNISCQVSEIKIENRQMEEQNRQDPRKINWSEIVLSALLIMFLTDPLSLFQEETRLFGQGSNTKISLGAAQGNESDSSYVQNIEKTFYPQKMKAEALANRFIPLLPKELRQQTSWRVDPGRNGFTLTGPIQSIAIAEQLIPKMDQNLQLTDGYVDVGLVPQNKDQRKQASVSQTAENRPSQKMEQYYDPAQNRYVRVAWQSDSAILPNSEPQNNPVVFGGDSESAKRVRDQEKDLDLVAYQCSSNNIFQAEVQVKQKFAHNPGITIASNSAAGKIFVMANRQDQQLVGAYLGSLKIFPVTDAIRQTDSRIADGTVYPVTGESEETAVAQPASQVKGQLAYSPSKKKVQELEKIAGALFGNRFQRISKASSAGQTPSEAARSCYRFFKRPANDEPIGRTCDVEFDPLNQKIFIQGDNAICAQMFQLFLALEADPQTKGNVRRFISIRQTDPKKIREILDIYNRKRRQGSSGQSGASLERKPSIGFADYVQSGAPDLISQKNDFLSNDSQNIRQVAWQNDAGGASGSIGISPDASGMVNGTDNFGSGHGVGVVQDYIPQVLPELDVVIIDAPESEYKRIENMIREIEELAKLAEPTVEIYNLKHINCVMLQGILQELHSEMFVTKQGRVIIFAMQNPNAILLVGWGQAFTSMKDLINTFDQPIQESNSMIRVIRLQYASAMETASQLMNYFPQPQPISGGMSPRIRVFPDTRTNSLVIQAAPNDLAEIQRVLMELDVNKAAPKLMVKTYKLKNLLAQDMKQTLMNAILPSVSGTSESNAAKYPILQILSVDADSKRLIESGIMTDVSITADPYNNQLVVTAPEDCMELLEKLIQLLDIAPAKAQIKIFRIINGDAPQMEKTLRSLLPTGQGAMPSLPNAEGEETFVPVRLSVDTRTNCIIAAAAPKDLKILEALIVSLDRKDNMERKEVIVPLRNVQALSVAKAIDDYLTRKQKLEIASEALSVYQMFEANVIVIPESITNSLIISATPKYLDEIQKLVKEFDRDPPQVVIQVLIGEVTLTDHEEFGIEAGLQDAVSFDRSVITTTTSGSATGIPGYDMIGNNTIGQNMNAANQTTVAGQVLNTLGMGRTSTSSNFGGLVLSASSRSVEVTLRALLEKSRLQVLSRPQITAMDNQQAFILVGQRVPRVDKANMTDYGISSSVTDANVGLILLVTPRVSDDGRVIMEIGVEKSSLAGDSDAVPIFVADNQVIKSQSINTTQAMTAISAQDGETVMLGGLISSSKEKVRHGIPCISDLPWVGWLFRYDQYSEARKELLIVMTPRIVRDQEDIEEIKRIEASRMNWCLADAMALNGNMGLFDPLSGQCPDWGNCPPKTIPFHHTNDRMKDLDDVKQYCPDNDYAQKKHDPQTGKVKRVQNNSFNGYQDGYEYEVNSGDVINEGAEVFNSNSGSKTLPAPPVLETQENISDLPQNSMKSGKTINSRPQMVIPRQKSSDSGKMSPQTKNNTSRNIQSGNAQRRNSQSDTASMRKAQTDRSSSGATNLDYSRSIDSLPGNVQSMSAGYASSEYAANEIVPSQIPPTRVLQQGVPQMARSEAFVSSSEITPMGYSENSAYYPATGGLSGSNGSSETKGDSSFISRPEIIQTVPAEQKGPIPQTRPVSPEQLRQIYQQEDPSFGRNENNSAKSLDARNSLKGSSGRITADQLYAPASNGNVRGSALSMTANQSGHNSYSDLSSGGRSEFSQEKGKGSPYQNLTNIHKEDWHKIQQASYELPKDGVKLY